MRLRFAVLASVLTSFVVIAAPGIVNAAPRHNHGLTIDALPRHIVSGEGVLIYGQLEGTDNSGKAIILYRHLSDSHRGSVKIGETTTNSNGQYEFTREEGGVLTNRSWFVREAGVPGVHSRTVYAHVDALVSLFASKLSSDTNHPILFYGHVSANHRFERVLLQEQRGSGGDDWRTIGTTSTGAGSNFYVTHSWRRPGDDGAGSHDVRAVFTGDARNDRGESDAATVTIQQAQVPGFTINSSGPVIAGGQSVTISGVLDAAATTTAAAPTSVTLFRRDDGTRFFHAVESTRTAADGSYSFSGLAPTHNGVYQVRTTLAPQRRTAQLFEGVKDVVTLSASSSMDTAGESVTFTGTVAPDKVGHLVYLQRKGADGDWHNVAVAVVNSVSGFTFTRPFGEPGTKLLRARIHGDPENVGATSAPVTVTVAGVSTVGSLPPNS